MPVIININELTLPYFLLLVLRRKEVHVLAVDPLFPPLERILRAVVDRARAAGRARLLLDLFPKFNHVIEQPATIYIYNIFEETEDWLNEHYGFAAAERRADEYVMAYKQVTCNYTRHKYLPLLLLDAATERFGPEGVRIRGLLADTAALFAAYFGRPLPGHVRFTRVPRALVNLATALGMTAYGLGWIAYRTRPLPVRARRFFLAADYIEDVRDFRLYHELAEGGPILLVVRSSPRGVDHIGELKHYAACRPVDGAFGPGNAIAAAAMVVRDGLRLFAKFRTCEPPHFYRVAALPVKRAILRAFFTRFQPEYFWGRDDYNVEHILRRQELHRVGGESHGVAHGASGVSILEPMWRYISYDRYYMFGRAIYDSHWKDTWARDMEIVPVGTFGATREDYARINEPRPNDIIVFTSVFAANEKTRLFVRALAEAFPERKIILSPKNTVVDLESTKQTVAACRAGLSNVVIADGRINLFERLRMARYAVSDASTTVIEALQFGLYSFFMDVSDEQRACYYRRYPDLCLNTPAEAVERIRGIESGAWVYPRESFSDLVDLSGRVYFDVVREGMGLPAREDAISIVERMGEGVPKRRSVRPGTAVGS